MVFSLLAGAGPLYWFAHNQALYGDALGIRLAGVGDDELGAGDRSLRFVDERDLERARGEGRVGGGEAIVRGEELT